MSSSAPQPIETIRHSLYKRAERWWWVALACVIVGVAASTLLASSFLPRAGFLEFGVLLLSLVAPVLAAFARRHSGDVAGHADQCRRAFMYRDALGAETSLEEQRLVALWPADTPLNPVTTQRPYFSSIDPRSAGRLADAVGESAFFTAELAGVMARAGLMVFGGCVLALLAAVGAFTNLPVDEATLSQFRSAVGIVALVTLSLLTVEVLMTALAYQTLSRRSREISRNASDLREFADPSVLTAMRLAESYSIALAANLPIPNFIYRRCRDRIDRAYRLELEDEPR